MCGFGSKAGRNKCITNECKWILTITKKVLNQLSPGNTIQLRRARPEEAQELTKIAMRLKQSNGYDDSFMNACEDVVLQIMLNQVK